MKNTTPLQLTRHELIRAIQLWVVANERTVITATQIDAAKVAVVGDAAGTLLPVTEIKDIAIHGSVMLSLDDFLSALQTYVYVEYGLFLPITVYETGQIEAEGSIARFSIYSYYIQGVHLPCTE